jgi:heterodisulfide reductase subunit B
MKYGFFLGCIIPHRYPGIEVATRLVFERFGVKVVDLEGASCCPAPGVFASFDLSLWLAVAARNLSIAEAKGVDVITGCNGCFGTLQEAHHLLEQNRELVERVNGELEVIGRRYAGSSRVLHVIEVLDELTFEPVRRLDLKVAVHYGCHFLRPNEVRQQGDVESPSILDRLVERTGATSVSYRDKLSCCGAGGGVRSGNPEVALDMTAEKLSNMQRAGAECIVTPCAFCHLQFDRGQREVKERLSGEFNLPVLHIMQLYGLAMGFSPEELGLDTQQIPLDRIKNKIE